MKTAIMHNKTFYAIMGFIFAVAAYQVPVSIVGLAIASTGASNLIKASVLIQFVAGISLSIIAYRGVSNRALKIGMRSCYGLVLGTLFAIGAYTILSSI